MDPEDPRAPPMDVWNRLSPAERQRILDSLPSEVELMPPEGDEHRLPKQRGLEALDAYFRQLGRRVYLSAELPVYYPGEAMFAPDLIAVSDVEPHPRNHWTVAHEGKGLDFALEVTLAGSRKKDLEDNVVRFARLGIAEYFVFDRKRGRLHGWRLPQGAAAYQAIVPQAGRWSSSILQLDLAVEADRFRFYAGSAMLPDAVELIERANRLSEDLQNRLDDMERQLTEEQQRAEQEQRRAEQEQRRAEQEREQREALERRVLELEAELKRLKR